jgi:predicted nucleic-acid-binding Zn-ribbon protein
MKNTGKCPKCGSEEILVPPKMNESSYLQYGLMSSVAITRLVCAQCGFVEHWIDDKEDLEKLQKKCKRLRVKKP